MTVKEIMEQIREGLTGEYNVDMVYLESQADKYRSTKDGTKKCFIFASSHPC